MTEPEHLDPNTVPRWMAEAAMRTSPEAMGWLAAGYLAGVAVGRKSGPCMARLELTPIGAVNFPLSPISCELAHGHIGGHSNEKGTKWMDPPTVEEQP